MKMPEEIKKETKENGEQAEPVRPERNPALETDKASVGAASKRDRLLLDGYEFESRAVYAQAQKEVERIAYIRANTDMKNPKELRKLYDSLTEQRSFRTPVGIGFLRELQRFLARDEKQRRSMKAIPVPSGKKERRGEAAPTGPYPASARLELEAEYRTKFRNQRIIIGFLTLLVLILFVFTWVERNPDVEKARNEVLDEYAGWKEELEAKEEELKAREKALAGQEKAPQGESRQGNDAPD